jgi:hypothetical protein
MTPYHTDTFFTIKSKELYEKMQYEYKKLLEDMSPYNIFNFFVTAYHLKDYIKVEYDLNETNDIRTFKNMDELLNISGFIANKGKHFSVNSSSYENMKARYYSGKFDGSMKFDGTWQIGEGEKYKILDNNNNIHNIEDIAKELLAEWKDFIITRNIF